MKIKVTKKDYSDVINIPKEKHRYPSHQSRFLRHLMSLLSGFELKATNFKCDNSEIEKLSKDEPVLFLMNHSSFTDLQITARLLKDREYHIVITNDGIVGKEWLMRKVGCIPTRKFISDPLLVKDMLYTVNTLKSSILMFPEASYSFGGTETALPDSMGKCIKLLKVPVVMIRTKGAFLRDPLYNNLQKRKTDVSAEVNCLLTKEEIEEKTSEEINELLKSEFVYDHFKEQKESNVLIDEPFRADGLERVLYKCPKCLAEGRMVGKGTKVLCEVCSASYELKEDGQLKCENGETEYKYVTDWYKWERECVLEEIKEGKYNLDTEVGIMMLVDSKSMYDIGEGRLKHSAEGFELHGADGQLSFKVKPRATYSLYADYFWYEIGDVVSIGDSKAQYYCFPKTALPVAKVRLATEELYKISR